MSNNRNAREVLRNPQRQKDAHASAIPILVWADDIVAQAQHSLFVEGFATPIDSATGEADCH